MGLRSAYILCLVRCSVRVPYRCVVVFRVELGVCAIVGLLGVRVLSKVCGGPLCGLVRGTQSVLGLCVVG